MPRCLKRGKGRGHTPWVASWAALRWRLNGFQLIPSGSSTVGPFPAKVVLTHSSTARKS